MLVKTTCCHSHHSYRVGIPVSIPMWQATPHFLGWRTPFPSTMRTEGVRSGRCRLCNCLGGKRVSGLALGSWDRPLKRNCLNNSPAFQRVTQGSWTLWMQENPVCKELSSQPSASLCKRPAEQAIRTYISTRIYLGVLTDKQIVMQSDRTYLKVVFGQVNNDIPGAGVNLITHNEAIWKNCDIFVMKWKWYVSDLKR